MTSENAQELYLSLVTNKMGEKIPLFVHQNREVLRLASWEWLSQQDHDYWLIGIEIQKISLALIWQM